MCLQRIALTHSVASTIWASAANALSTISNTHLIPVQSSLWAFLAHPMHQLAAAKRGVMRMDPIRWVALKVPFKQQWVLRCLKHWLPWVLSTSFAAKRTAAVFLHTLCNLTLPLVAAGWALPLSPDVTARKHLLRCLGVLVMVRIFCLPRCFSSKRVMLT